VDLAHREFLWLLLVVPLLLVRIARGRRRRFEQWAVLGQGGRLPGDGATGWILAIACLAVALCEPRWGRVPAPPFPPGHDVVLVLDTSRSMGAEDAVPDRLALAVEAARGLVAALGREPGNRVAVVAFAGRGVVRCPLSENLGAVDDTLQRLRPGDVRPGGTDLGAALNAALDVFAHGEPSGRATIVVFSDGEDHVGSWQAALDRLRAAAVIVHTVAFGDAENGHPVPAGRGRGSEPITYQGVSVLSKRTDRPLAAIAEATGGAMVPMGLAPADLGALYLERIEPIARQKRETISLHASERAERFPWFVLAALVLGLAGSWPSRGGRLRWREPRRPRALRWLGLIAVLVLAPGAAQTQPRTAAAFVEAGRSAFDGARWAEALAAFETAMTLDPDSPVPRFDAAATLFQMERYSEALEHYRAARDRATASFRTKIDYAMGNTALAVGDVAGALRHYDACIASTAPGADLETVRRDAEINRRFAQEAARKNLVPPRSGGDSSRSPRSPSPASKDQEPKPDADHAASGQAGGERRGPGGARGGGTAPPEVGTPEQRLEAALERVRAARRRRFEEPPPSPDNAASRKDW
jgi:Ca-activated chloride channel family protein